MPAGFNIDIDKPCYPVAFLEEQRHDKTLRASED